MEFLSYKAEGPETLSLTTGLVARIWGSTPSRPGLSLSLGTQALLQAITGRGHWRSGPPAKSQKNTLENKVLGIYPRETLAPVLKRYSKPRS